MKTFYLPTLCLGAVAMSPVVAGHSAPRAKLAVDLPAASACAADLGRQRDVVPLPRSGRGDFSKGGRRLKELSRGVQQRIAKREAFETSLGKIPTA